MKKLMYIATSFVALKASCANLPSQVIAQPMPTPTSSHVTIKNHLSVTGFKMGVHGSMGAFSMSGNYYDSSSSSTYMDGVTANQNKNISIELSNLLGSYSYGLVIGYSKALSSNWALGIDLTVKNKTNSATLSSVEQVKEFMNAQNTKLKTDNLGSIDDIHLKIQGINLEASLPVSYLISNKVSFDFGPMFGMYIKPTAGVKGNGLFTTNPLNVEVNFEVNNINLKNKENEYLNLTFGTLFGANVGGFIGMTFAVLPHMVISPRAHVNYVFGTTNFTMVDQNSAVIKDTDSANLSINLNYGLSLNIAYNY